MVTDVHADYGYITMIKKPQETTDTSEPTRLWANVDPRRINLEASSVHLLRARRQ